MDPLKAAAATLFCLALFWLAFRLTRRLVDLAIAGGYDEERRRLAEEAAQAEAAGVTGSVADPVFASAAKQPRAAGHG